MLGWTIPFPVPSLAPPDARPLNLDMHNSLGPAPLPRRLSPLVYDLSPPQQEEPRPQVQWEQSGVCRDPSGLQLVELVLDAFIVLLLSCCAVVIYMN